MVIVCKADGVMKHRTSLFTHGRWTHNEVAALVTTHLVVDSNVYKGTSKTMEHASLEKPGMCTMGGSNVTDTKVWCNFSI